MEPTEGNVQPEEAVVEEEVVARGAVAVEDPFSYDSVLTPALFDAPSHELAALSQQILVRRARALDAVEVMDADLRALNNRLEQLARESVRRGARPPAPWSP